MSDARSRAKASTPDKTLDGEDVEDILVMSAGLHDNAFFTIKYPDDRSSHAVNKMWRAILTAGYDRIVWVQPSAVHRQVPFIANCSHLKQILRPTCMQYTQLQLTNQRTLVLHEIIRRSYETVRAELPDGGTPVRWVDSYPISEVRDDHTKTHADMVHYCDEFNRELLQVVLHEICGCKGHSPDWPKVQSVPK